MSKSRSRLRVALIAVFTYLVMFMAAPAAQAGMIGTDVQLEHRTHAAKVAQVRALLSQKRVQDQMIALGVKPADAQARVASLTNEQLNAVQGQLQNLPAGGGVLVIIGIVFVVLIILDLLDVIHIFK